LVWWYIGSLRLSLDEKVQLRCVNSANVTLQIVLASDCGPATVWVIKNYSVVERSLWMEMGN